MHHDGDKVIGLQFLGKEDALIAKIGITDNSNLDRMT